MTKKAVYDKILWGEKMKINVKYSKRKTLSLEITREAEVLVRAPLRTSDKTINNFVNKHLDWIYSHIERRKALNEARLELTEGEIEHLRALAKEIIPIKVEKYSRIMGIIPEHVSINAAKTRFGSCSGKNRLNFSCRLMSYPEAAIDYVVVHELAHIKHHNHSKEFWALVESYMPDYKERKKLLKG